MTPKHIIELAALRILNDAPNQLFTTRQLLGDINGASRHAVSHMELNAALEGLADCAPPQIVRTAAPEKTQGMLNQITSAGILRVLKAPPANEL